MSKFVVKSEVMQRFTALYKSLSSNAPEDLKCFRLEIANNKIFLIGCNEYVACVELLGETNQENDVCYIKVNNALLESIEKENNINGIYTFETLPELAIGSVSASDGYKFNDFIVWPDEHILENWRNWFTTPTESKGFMYCTLYQVQTLFETSPTGEIVFPKDINSENPVIVRDVNNDNWIGAFIPSFDGKKVIKPAELPEWL